MLSLEGGYDLPSICDSAEECVRVLLGDEPSAISEEELARVPCQNAIYTLQKVIAIQVHQKILCWFNILFFPAQKTLKIRKFICEGGDYHLPSF